MGLSYPIPEKSPRINGVSKLINDFSEKGGVDRFITEDFFYWQDCSAIEILDDAYNQYVTESKTFPLASKQAFKLGGVAVFESVLHSKDIHTEKIPDGSFIEADIWAQVYTRFIEVFSPDCHIETEDPRIAFSGLARKARERHLELDDVCDSLFDNYSARYDRSVAERMMFGIGFTLQQWDIFWPKICEDIFIDYQSTRGGDHFNPDLLLQ
jgi:hypothetical protein